MRKVLVRPLITEKMNDLTESQSKYGFMVNINSNKIEIKKAIKAKFNVDVVDINTIKMKGKTKTQFTRKGKFEGKAPAYKKAIVTLKEGQTIDLFEEV
ncbi:MAG: 50S ribosomal protein L23 [Ignavibacteriae bacterium]|nr:MAG: 50S ribosomal protein L23 [Ignavibacteriota bacterium]